MTPIFSLFFFGGGGGGVQHVYGTKFMLTVAYNGNPWPVTTDITIGKIRNNI